jgi:hypothetical protein
MGIPVGTRLYLCPTHELTGRVWVLPMGIKVYPYPVHAGTVPVGKIAILKLHLTVTFFLRLREINIVIKKPNTPQLSLSYRSCQHLKHISEQFFSRE